VDNLESLTDTGQSDQIETLERDRSWKEEEFDFVLQFLRTILLKRKYISKARAKLH
jgi:hypothetical protein